MSRTFRERRATWTPMQRRMADNALRRVLPRRAPIAAQVFTAVELDGLDYHALAEELPLAAISAASFRPMLRDALAAGMDTGAFSPDQLYAQDPADLAYRVECVRVYHWRARALLREMLGEWVDLG